MINRLYYADNLQALREHVADDSVDLVYLDPPFNSNASYNLLFRSPAGISSDAQIEAFEDTWHWNDKAEDAFDQVMRSGYGKAFELLNAMRGFLGENDMMAYLAMMAIRLIELHRVLKPTGSLYLHCDPTASHYLKLLLDGVFGPANYLNEITWKRTTAHNDSGKFGRNTDIILFYSKSPERVWNTIYTAYNDDYIARFRNKDVDGRLWMDDNLTAKGLSGGGYTYEYKGCSSLWRVPPDTMRLDAEGRLHFTRAGGIRLKRYLDEAKGLPVQALWDDISPINSRAQERLGYPTQKPLSLLERIISASSNPGDLVLDPFCGCGTAVHAAQKLGRRWIGIDVTHLAISLVEKRMKDAFPGIEFTVEGAPQDLASALDLAEREKYQFQWWALLMIDAQPFGGRKRGADGGIDGTIYLRLDARGRIQRALVSVKGGANVNVSMIRDLKGVMEREKAPFGIFLTAAPSSRPMREEAASAGLWRDPLTDEAFPRLQIVTLADLFQGKRPRPPNTDRAAAFKKPAREDGRTQPSLL